MPRFFLPAIVLVLAQVAHGQTVTAQLLTSSDTGVWLFACSPPGDTGHLFIVSQFGTIRVFDLTARQLLPTPFLSLAGLNAGDETGLLGMAFHPDYQHNGFFYVYYSTNSLRTVARFRVNPSNPNVALASPTIILQVTTPAIGFHQGGWIGFGPNGYLYIAWGEATQGVNAQTITNNLLGKMLRLDVNGPDGIPGTADDDGFPSDSTRNYRIPATNPFVGADGEDEIWEYGLRNPFRCSFDRSTGELWIGDPGDTNMEEVDFVPAGQGGLNFGWPCMEGTLCTGDPSCTCNAPALRLPVYTYTHAPGIRAVIGGYVYRGCAIPWLRGRYVFGDYGGRVWSLGWNGTSVTDIADLSAQLPVGAIRSFGEDANGELYICTPTNVYAILPAPAYLDCNGNGIPDGCEIANGTAPDLNHNFIIDTCEHACNADYNDDGDIGTDADIEAFFLCLAGSCCSMCPPSADFNGDGDVGTDADIESFFRVLAGGSC